MATVKELRQQLEAALRDTFTGVPDDSEVQTVMSPGTFQGNSYTVILGVSSWFSGHSPNAQCGKTIPFSTTLPTSHAKLGTCGTPPRTYTSYTITVKPKDN
jgi:hypothetical protein